mgnify:CR=1 FL=1
MKTFLLFVTYTAKDGQAQNFVNELEKSGAASLVRAEDGCIRYDYYYSAKDKNTVLLFEEWESEEKQQIHLTQPHIAQIKEIKEKYILSTELRKA